MKDNNWMWALYKLSSTFPVSIQCERGTAFTVYLTGRVIFLDFQSQENQKADISEYRSSIFGYSSHFLSCLPDYMKTGINPSSKIPNQIPLLRNKNEQTKQVACFMTGGRRGPTFHWCETREERLRDRALRWHCGRHHGRVLRAVPWESCLPGQRSAGQGPPLWVPTYSPRPATGVRSGVRSQLFHSGGNTVHASLPVQRTNGAEG